MPIDINQSKNIPAKLETEYNHYLYNESQSAMKDLGLIEPWGKQKDRINLNGTVIIDHATQTFKIDDKELDRHQALTVAIGLIEYYKTHDFIDKKDNLWEIREHLKTMLE